MWTFALAAVLTCPAQAGDLTLSRVRATYGLLGESRPDNKLLPGDQLTISFDIENIKPAANGNVAYSIAMDVTDEKGKKIFSQEPRDLEASISLGGNKLPGFVSLNVGLDQPAGKYNVKVTVKDRTAGASKSITSTYEVLPKAFGLVRLTTTLDAEGQVPAACVSEGQSLWINFLAVGFGRDMDQPNLAVSMTVLDDAGKPTLDKPFTGEVKKDVPKTAQSVPMQFMLDLNRAGKFTVQLKATDKVSGKTATLSLPLTVQKGK
jgi:hypothetical protein